MSLQFLAGRASPVSPALSAPHASPASTPGASQIAGLLQEKSASGQVLRVTRIVTGQELIIGRDKHQCQYTLEDPFVSNKHLRIYTVVYDADSNEIPPLVFAEDLSRHGTFWNSSHIGKGNGGFLLSDGDTLRLSSRTIFTFMRLGLDDSLEQFDLRQEREMKTFAKDYLITDRLLGTGAHGKVYMAIERHHRSQLACKVVDLRKFHTAPRSRIGRVEKAAAAEDVDTRVQLRKVKQWAERRGGGDKLEEKLRQYYREVEILANIHHPNIVGLEKVYVTDYTLYIFQELVTAGDLFAYLNHKGGRLSDVEAAVIIRQVLIALQYLHSKEIAHRDLKPENILMTSLAAGCRVVLSDFGAAKRIFPRHTRMTTTQGTTDYMAPEITVDKLGSSKRGYTLAVDLWAVACVTVLLVTGDSAFADPLTRQYSEKMGQKADLTTLEQSAAWTMVGDRPKDFVKQLLLVDEKARMTANEALVHPWFSNEFHKLEFEDLYRRATKNWRPKTPKPPVIEFLKGYKVRTLTCSEELLEAHQDAHKRTPKPIDPPYKPFARNMNLAFLPKRKYNPYNTMPPVVKTAIKEYWTPPRNRKPFASSSPVEVSLPRVMRSPLSRTISEASAKIASGTYLNVRKDKKHAPKTTPKAQDEQLRPNTPVVDHREVEMLYLWCRTGSEAPAQSRSDVNLNIRNDSRNIKQKVQDKRVQEITPLGGWVWRGGETNEEFVPRALAVERPAKSRAPYSSLLWREETPEPPERRFSLEERPPTPRPSREPQSSILALSGRLGSPHADLPNQMARVSKLKTKPSSDLPVANVKKRRRGSVYDLVLDDTDASDLAAPESKRPKHATENDVFNANK